MANASRSSVAFFPSLSSFVSRASRLAVSARRSTRNDRRRREAKECGLQVERFEARVALDGGGVFIPVGVPPAGFPATFTAAQSLVAPPVPQPIAPNFVTQEGALNVSGHGLNLANATADALANLDIARAKFVSDNPHVLKSGFTITWRPPRTSSHQDGLLGCTVVASQTYTISAPYGNLGYNEIRTWQEIVAESVKRAVDDGKFSIRIFTTSIPNALGGGWGGNVVFGPTVFCGTVTTVLEPYIAKIVTERSFAPQHYVLYSFQKLGATTHSYFGIVDKQTGVVVAYIDPWRTGGAGFVFNVPTATTAGAVGGLPSVNSVGGPSNRRLIPVKQFPLNGGWLIDSSPVEFNVNKR